MSNPAATCSPDCTNACQRFKDFDCDQCELCGFCERFPRKGCQFCRRGNTNEEKAENCMMRCTKGITSSVAYTTGLVVRIFWTLFII